MQLSKDLNNDFRKKYKDGIVNGVEFSCETLTSGHWPENVVVSCKLPPDMVAVSTKFDEYYRNKHANRNLKWLFHHGSVEIQPSFTKKKYFFTTNVV